MGKALIETATRRCVNVIVDGPDYEPPEGYELQTDVDAAIDKVWNGTGYAPIPDSHFEELADRAISVVDETIAEALFEIAKAAKTGDWRAFQLADGTPVTNKVSFMRWLKEIYRAKHG